MQWFPAPDIFPHAHSLLNVAEIHRGVRSEEGVTFNPNGCEVIFAHDSGCWVGDEKALQECNLAEYDAYVLELTMNIGTWMDMGDIKSHVEKAFAVGSSAVLERLMAVGIAPVAASTNVTVPAALGATIATGRSSASRRPPPVPARPCRPSTPSSPTARPPRSVRSARLKRNWLTRPTTSAVPGRS